MLRLPNLPKLPDFFRSKKMDIIQRMRLRQYFTYAGILLILIFFGIAIATNMFNGGQKTEAAIIVNGDDITINGGNYSVDNSGILYSDPGIVLHNQVDDNTLMDPSYYSYLFDKTNVVFDAVNTNLVLQNGATLIVEKELNVKNLTIGSGSKVTSPSVDTDGLINHPLYDRDYWEMRLTGFMMLMPGTVTWIRSDGTDDAVMVEASASNNAYSSPNWQPVYSQKSGGYSGWGPDLNTGEAEFKNSIRNDLLTNGSGDVIYVPIRITMADCTGNARLQLISRTYSIGWSGPTDARTPFGAIYGVNADGTVNDSVGSGRGRVDFEYFLDTHQIFGTLPDRSLGSSSAVKMIEKPNITLFDDFKAGYGNRTGSDSLGNWATSFTMSWSTEGNFDSPVADTRAIYEGRYNALNYDSNENSKLLDFSGLRRLPGGIQLNVADTVTISSDAIGIDVSGKGYPGQKWQDARPLDRGASLNTAGNLGQPGGGYTKEGNDWVGSAGAHAGVGGNWMYAPGTSPYGATTYGTSTNPKTLGSGGGGSSEANRNGGHLSDGGNGGGAVTVNARILNITRPRDGGFIRRPSIAAILANGSPGARRQNDLYNWVGTGGAGGSVNINVQTLSLSEPNVNLFSARGAGYLDTPLNKYLFGWGGEDKYLNFSGGGGGYIYIRYGSGDSVQNVISYSNVSGGTSNPDNGAERVRWATGGDGLVNVDSTGQALLTIRKELTPVQRGGVTIPATVNCSVSLDSRCFNPYALRPGDEIKVTLKVQDIQARTKIEDELLTQQGIVGGYYCDPITASIDPTYGSDAEEGLVSWDVPAAVAGESSFSYQCKVKKNS